jgi:hypothetical protein
LLLGATSELVSQCLGVARSQLTVRIKRSVSPRVLQSRPVNDVELVIEIQQQVIERPAMATVGSGDYCVKLAKHVAAGDQRETGLLANA